MFFFLIGATIAVAVLANILYSIIEDLPKTEEQEAIRAEFVEIEEMICSLMSGEGMK